MDHFPTLQHLARLHGIQPVFFEISGERRLADSDSLIRLLQAWGVPIERPADAPSLLRERRQQLWRRILEPVCVAWDGQGTVPIRLPEAIANGPFRAHLRHENGDEHAWEGDLQDLPTTRRKTIDGEACVVRQLPVRDVPNGYHTLKVELPAGATASTRIIASPRIAWRPEGNATQSWGVFAPLYAIHRQRSWGAGDFSDLEAMMGWVAQQGGQFVATLPLLAWLSEVSDDPSPYSPASRLFWNEFYLDLTQIPEFPSSTTVQSQVASPAFQRRLAELRQTDLVQYTEQMDLKRSVLRQLATEFFEQPADRQQELEEFRRSHPEVDRYAVFRAVGDRQGEVWTQWPQRQRNGTVDESDYDQADYRYHLYTQWQVERQLQSLRTRADSLGTLWYLDFPMGVNRAGYDVWRWRDVFALGASGGAPPDVFFTKGQNWGFPPLHPERLREQGYDYLIRSLRRHLQCARLLRVDHVMGLHRMFWIPAGTGAAGGGYVRYHSEEMFAIVILESRRARAQIVGENLGTVPDAVNRALEQHRIKDMYVLQFSGSADADPPLHPPSDRSVASLNTHDTPTFAAFWNGHDIDDRSELGLLDDGQAQHEHEERARLREALVAFLQRENRLPKGEHEPRDVLKGLLTWLADGPAPVVLVTLEDLWGETQPQNTPGTFEERPNWRRKARHSMEEFSQLPAVQELLAAVADCRR
ncbi:4-alpha-glucanotransferase [Maioricimonas rarisocia]|uniref:4-alpha-glucanotransferase n=1 Tax=Maioricimonas rarisocia TaxID=2528026 RepID=A0A517Z2P3_9PLAN|nr:4-alpha-glucanotransferase [Maioricimonas rarisocia]QDU36741.1 4-alpha-glucanotransferase [Maioricimonas rarisocia]